LRGLTRGGRVAETSFENKVGILSYLWLNYRDHEDWKDFIAWSDLGLPLAYMLENQIVAIPAEEDENEFSHAMGFIDETWDMFLTKAGALEDTGFDDIEEILGTDESGWGEEDEEDEIVELNETDEQARKYNLGFEAGASAEQKRVQEVISMHKRWAKEKNRASEFMFWDSAGEVLTPINFEYNEEKYWEDLRNEGF
jgi:hypothetical protein